MATNTTNYGWTKPDYEDDADIAVLNETFDAIDAQVKTVETALNSKQNALSSAQLAAVNSGVDSAKVAQITTNKNNISMIGKNIVVDTFATNKIAHIPISTDYASLIVTGFFQGIGNVYLAVPIRGGVVDTIINLLTNQAVSATLQGMFNFDSDNKTLDISTGFNGISTVTVIGCYQI